MNTHHHEHEEKKEDGGELTQCKKERDEFLELSQRLKADFLNYKKDQERASARMLETAGEHVIREVLPVLDSFDQALKAIPPDAQHSTWIVGVRNIKSQLDAVVRKIGVTEIKTIGEPFNPEFHETVAHEEGDDHGRIVEELQKGYELRGKVLRPAKVKIVTNNT
ncbi:MAG: nucleotide exchange factor GrpE [Patescibacteria group bacterium]